MLLVYIFLMVHNWKS